MVIRYGAGKEGVEAEGTHVQVEGDWFVQLLDLHLHCEERLHCGEETLEHGWVQLEEDVLVQLVQLRQQLDLHVPTSWSCLYVHVCEGGKALLCHLNVEESGLYLPAGLVLPLRPAGQHSKMKNLAYFSC